MAGLSQVFQIGQNTTRDLVVPFEPEWVALDNPGTYWVHFPTAIGAFQWIRPGVFNAIVPSPGTSNFIRVTTADVPPGFPAPVASTALATITVYERGYYGAGSPLAPNPGVPGLATDTNAADIQPIAAATNGAGTVGLAGDAGHFHAAQTRFCARAYPSVGTALTNVAGNVSLDTIDFDPNGNFAASAYTAPRTGKYLIEAAVTIPASVGNNSIQPGISVNGTTVRVGPAIPNTTAAGTVKTPGSIVSVIALSATDVVRLQATVAANVTSSTGSPWTWLSICYLGD